MKCSTCWSAHTAGQNLECSLTDLISSYFAVLIQSDSTIWKEYCFTCFQSLLDPDDIIDFEKRCQDCESRVDIDVHNCERIDNKIGRAELAQQAKALQILLLELKELKDLIPKVVGDAIAVSIPRSMTYGGS
jgi:hypothetical protein